MDRISFLTFRANFPNLESVGKCRSNWTRQELWKAFEHAQRRTVSPTAPGFSETEARLLGNTSHDHLSALAGPHHAQRALASATCDMVRCAERAGSWLFSYSGPEQANKILRHAKRAQEMSACGHQPSCSNRLGESSRLAVFLLFCKEKGFCARPLVAPAGVI